MAWLRLFESRGCGCSIPLGRARDALSPRRPAFSDFLLQRQGKCPTALDAVLRYHDNVLGTFEKKEYRIAIACSERMCAMHCRYLDASHERIATCRRERERFRAREGSDSARSMRKSWLAHAVQSV